MAYLKKDAPPGLVEILHQVEARADECWRPLQILEKPSNVVVWALLAGGIERVERERARRGTHTPHFEAILGNLGRLIATALKWAMRHAPAVSRPLDRRWTAELGAEVEQALSVALAYNHFEVCFQAFHKDLVVAEAVGPELVRFTTPGAERDRQVSAYQKGHRPPDERFTLPRPDQMPVAPRVMEAFERVLGGCVQTGARRVDYGEPWALWRELLPEYRGRVSAATRRAGDLSLGEYRLDEFNEFYAALVTICAAHDFLCFQWGRHCGTYPMESAVMVRPAAGWAEVLSELSGVGCESCRVMLSDLTFSVPRSVDLHVYPLVPLDGENETLALAPPFPLHGRHDENILRVCSQRRPLVYDVTSRAKEDEMLAEVRTAGRRYGTDGPFPLPAPTPDIDLIMADETHSTVIIAELKWIRKTVRPAEIRDRDADVMKGVGQLSSIQQYLAANPACLQAQGRLPRLVNQYDRVCYLLVARDHWRWKSPDGIAIVEFDAFVRALARSGNLHDVVAGLLTYDWLPVEGRDFIVQYDNATANGVSIESQVFYSTEPGLEA